MAAGTDGSASCPVTVISEPNLRSKQRQDITLLDQAGPEEVLSALQTQHLQFRRTGFAANRTWTRPAQREQHIFAMGPLNFFICAYNNNNINNN